VHPNAALSAEAAEAAGRQAAFWPMQLLLLQHQQELQAVDLVGYAADLELDVDRFREDLRRDARADRVATITLS
jgi:protein-disulfide isomerase